MTGWLKTSVLVLGAVIVLLAAGAFPVVGAPAVYRSGLMWLLGGVTAVLCAVGAWRLSKGGRLRFLSGLFFTFLSAAGAAGVCYFGSQAVGYASVGGPMWFGAVGMFCLAAVGLLFAGIFGFFAWRLQTKRLCLAALHLCGLLVLAGVCLDAVGEVAIPLHLVAGGRKTVHEVKGRDGTVLPLGFDLTLENFSLSYYGEPSYTLYHRQGGRQWLVAGKPVRQGGRLVLGERSWPLSDLRRSPDMPGPYLLAGTPEAPELLVEDARTVRDYCAGCRVDSLYRGRKESRKVDIRVNEPLSFKGVVIHLVSYRPMAGKTLVEFRVRRAPGRLLALGGMVGLIIFTAAWCWKRKENGIGGKELVA